MAQPLPFEVGAVEFPHDAASRTCAESKSQEVDHGSQNLVSFVPSSHQIIKKFSNYVKNGRILTPRTNHARQLKKQVRLMIDLFPNSVGNVA